MIDVSELEGSREYHAQIDKIVRQKTKLHIGDAVKVREDAKSGLHGQKGVIDSISSHTPITDIKKTYIMYLIRIESTGLLYGFTDDELQVLIAPEKVKFD